ncbi:MAG: response regulator [Candidatus Omnitrophota bacterium]|jgi:CheY-like chemotaxis protein
MAENQKSILVIDDEDDVCQIVKARFESLGYKVLTANEGAEGFRKTESSRPDVVLVDVRIPQGEDGLTFLRKLRSYRHDDIELQARMRKTPVIILTGVGATMQSLFELEGISGYIEKPFDLVNLQTKVEQVLQSS